MAWLGLVHYNGINFHLNSFHGFRAMTATLETKGPPIDNRWLWIDYYLSLLRTDMTDDDFSHHHDQGVISVTKGGTQKLPQTF
jgi:hypothetical protein